MSKNVLRSQEKGGFADYSYYRHKREIRRCQINGGAVLDSCFVQIRTHQQHFVLYQFLRAGALTGTKLAPTREVTRVRSYVHYCNDKNSKIPIEGVSYV